MGAAIKEIYDYMTTVSETNSLRGHYSLIAYSVDSESKHPNEFSFINISFTITNNVMSNNV